MIEAIVLIHLTGTLFFSRVGTEIVLLCMSSRADCGVFSIRTRITRQEARRTESRWAGSVFCFSLRFSEERISFGRLITRVYVCLGSAAGCCSMLPFCFFSLSCRLYLEKSHGARALARAGVSKGLPVVESRNRLDVNGIDGTAWIPQCVFPGDTGRLKTACPSPHHSNRETETITTRGL